jgi:hypothetical protein
MGEIKTAWEKAMEKVDKLGKASEEELKRLENIPTGNAMAAKFITDENNDFESQLTKYKGSGVRQYVIQGAMEVFLRNITLPHDDRDKYRADRSMQGIKIIKENKKQVDTIFDHIKNLMSYYEQARQHSFGQFKKDFEARIREAGKMLQNMPANSGNLEAQIQQQFQDEWRRASMELDAQYEKALEEQKQQLLKTA